MTPFIKFRSPGPISKYMCRGVKVVLLVFSTVVIFKTQKIKSQNVHRRLNEKMLQIKYKMYIKY